jgi:hypothetical protein
MATRKPRNPELAQAVNSLNQAARHVRNAVQGKIGEVRGAAAAELAKAKTAARKQTGVMQEKVEAALKRAEARLHKLIASAQKSLDDALRRVEKAAAKPAAKKSTATKATRARK